MKARIIIMDEYRDVDLLENIKLPIMAGTSSYIVISMRTSLTAHNYMEALLETIKVRSCFWRWVG